MKYKILLILLALIIICAGSSIHKADSVQVDWQFELDDLKGFAFDSIQVLVMQRTSKTNVWEKVGTFTPNSSGTFSFSVPQKTWVLIDISTFDPTISHSSLPFYSLEDGSSVSIYVDEFYLERDSLPIINKKTYFKRSSALSLDIPETTLSGTIFIENLHNKSDTYIIQFFDMQSFNKKSVGGLLPGHYQVTILDSHTKCIFLRKIYLEKGKSLKLSFFKSSC